ncbi:MAG: hypothetical protein OIF36_04805 [Alphaproteobacteria bacterium]|nr:hypothetical protein [Alphaproteobacteria bacterium]
MNSLLKLQEMEETKEFDYVEASCTSCGSQSCDGGGGSGGNVML